MAVSSRHLAIAAAFAAIYVIWGSTYLALALTLRSVPPLLLMAARCLAGGAILYGFAKATGAATPSARTWVRAALCGVVVFLMWQGERAVRLVAATHVFEAGCE